MDKINERLKKIREMKGDLNGIINRHLPLSDTAREALDESMQSLKRIEKDLQKIKRKK